MDHVALTLAFGVVVGLALGLVGGGGSILTVPILVYALGESVLSPATIFFQVEGLFGHLNLPGRWSRSLPTLQE